MPTRPRSHSARRGRQAADRVYNRTRRRLDPALAAAQQIRNSARWQKVRARVLSTHPLCADPYGMHSARAMEVVATQVDHKIALAERPDLAFDLANLQPLCVSCHQRKSRGERQHARGEVWLVCGPPASGKTTYVVRHKGPYDLTLDLDRMIGALSGRDWQGYRDFLPEIERLLPYAIAAYDGALQHLAALPLRGANAWVIGTLVDRRQREAVRRHLQARCLVLAVPYAACLRHIQSDPQRCRDLARWEPLIARWWATYQPGEHDEVL